MDVESWLTLTLPAAELVADLAMDEARRAGAQVSVAILDRGGHLLVFKRQAGASFHSIEIAQDKAYTALSFGRPSDQWDERLANASEMLRHGLMLRPRFTGFGGGLPILLDGQRVGAIGISGGTEAQDVAFAEAAIQGWLANRAG